MVHSTDGPRIKAKTGRHVGDELASGRRRNGLGSHCSFATDLLNIYSLQLQLPHVSKAGLRLPPCAGASTGQVD